jgi:hypothetical protein
MASAIADGTCGQPKKREKMASGSNGTRPVIFHALRTLRKVKAAFNATSMWLRNLPNSFLAFAFSLHNLV